MKKNLTPQEIIDQYVEAGNILAETTLSGDYKRGNKTVKKIQKIFEAI
ncbi:MAG: hypothetical protein FWD39_04555 [Clostridiales bacterium]|nr:hypothetical protein [Clostridiales bacterium]